MFMRCLLISDNLEADIVDTSDDDLEAVVEDDPDGPCGEDVHDETPLNPDDIQVCCDIVDNLILDTADGLPTPGSDICAPSDILDK
jgi:hypothetical protein